MKRRILFLMLGSLMLILSGCPFDSDFDLGDAMLPTADSRVLGTWENITDTVDQYVYVGSDNEEYPDYVVIKLLSSLSDDVNHEGLETYYTRFAKVAGLDFLVLELDMEWITGDPEIYFYYYQYKVINKNTVEIREVNDAYKNDEIESSEELKAWFEENLNNPDFFINTRKYKRAKQE